MPHRTAIVVLSFNNLYTILDVPPGKIISLHASVDLEHASPYLLAGADAAIAIHFLYERGFEVYEFTSDINGTVTYTFVNS